MRDKLGLIREIAAKGRARANRETGTHTPSCLHYGAYTKIRILAEDLLNRLGETVIPNPYVISIPGTATRFTKNIVNAHGACHLHAESAEFHFEHEPILVVPLRHPRSVWQTWYDRRREEHISHAFEWFWYKLHRCACMYRDIFWLPVDHPGYRDLYLGHISDAMGTQLVPRWDDRVGHDDPNKSERGPAPDIDLTDILLMPCIRQFYDREPPIWK